MCRHGYARAGFSFWVLLVSVEMQNVSAMPTPAVTDVEFEAAFLNQHGAEPLDVSRFQRRNITGPGIYHLDLFVNEHWQGRFDVTFTSQVQEQDAMPCYDRRLLQRIGVDVKRLPAQAQGKLNEQGTCLALIDVLALATETFDFANQRLDLSIEQLALDRSARDYIDPQQWDGGVGVGFLDYNLNLFNQNNRAAATGRQTQGYLGLRAGLNTGHWHWRHEGGVSWGQQQARDYQGIATYVQRELPQWKAQLTLGDAYTTGELFDSSGFRGIQLSSDDRMLPGSRRGFAPTVRGVANSNARVTVRQRGVVLHESTVAPGAFEIDDLYATGYGDDLIVSINEADGSVRTFTLPYQAVPLALRPGVDRFGLTAGTWRDSQVDDGPAFVQGTWQHGFTNLFSGHVGGTGAQDYNAMLLGGTFNTSYGALGLDLTHANTRLAGQGTQQGQALRLSYARYFPETATDLALASTHYASDGFYGFNDAVHVSRDHRSPLDAHRTGRAQMRTSLSLAQSLGEQAGRFSLSASTTRYRDDYASNLNYALGYFNRYKTLNYSVSVNRERDERGHLDTHYFLNVSVPLGRERRAHLSTSVTYDSQARSQAHAQLSAIADAEGQLSYGVGATAARDEHQRSTSSNANAQYRTSMGEFSGSVGAGTGYSQASLGVRGAFVGHAGGVTLSQPLDETFAIVHAPGAARARVLAQPGIRVDGNGYAVVPYLTPYSVNIIDLDPKGLSTDIELQVTSQQSVPGAGAVPLLHYPTTIGRTLLIHAKRTDGSPLPFGASVLDESDQELGLVGQGSRIFVRGIGQQGMLRVTWGQATHQQCWLNYVLPQQADGQTDLPQIEAHCQQGHSDDEA
ncbi:fimbrial biogenesis outer membrane usher protein [Pseudomonas sp. LS1212]|uniref:fimbria/pilus outer membrane usher protein n=1 Tax=Pseudomonas sp. LS1212 TaxID=2972478 RepID=UPI00215C1224|nr:fimbria/pilus outer membrane usher protein [Pseudomonas sp. LS1212]UVJ46076.1 fimbrial biogenesis outer membrane usher protein [Pseudomonas sp. LS1212]